jgi:lysophospholipase L1-like esterase
VPDRAVTDIAPVRSFPLRLLVGVLTLAVLELLARVAFPFLAGFERTRLALRGELGAAGQFQNCIGQPYLLYAPSPGFSNQHGLQHNAQGYRGPLVELERRAGFKRVLFLGGSTTYDWGVARPGDTYPAQVGRLLNETLPEGVAGVEVINGGLPFGTSAELLAHYHFKFHYFRPDLVVLEGGGNDAWAQKVPFYQPDYAHWRQPLVDVPVLSPFGIALLRSRLLSLLLVPSFGGVAPTSFSVVRSGRPPIQWFELPADGKLSDAHHAFLHNTETLVDMIRRDGAEVLLLPWRGQPGTHPELQPYIERNEALLWRIARDRNLAVAPFPASVISPANWADRGHVNEAGALEKARHVAPFVRAILFEEAAPAHAGAG